MRNFAGKIDRQHLDSAATAALGLPRGRHSRVGEVVGTPPRRINPAPTPHTAASTIGCPFRLGRLDPLHDLKKGVSDEFFQFHGRPSNPLFNEAITRRLASLLAPR